MSAPTRRRSRSRRLDDPDYPALTMSQAAELLGVQAAFLRSLDAAGVLAPHRSAGGHRRYSRAQLGLAARLRELLDDGHTLASAEADRGAAGRAGRRPRRRRPAPVRRRPAALRRHGRPGSPSVPAGGSRRTWPWTTRRPAVRSQHGYIHRKDDYLKRLRRIEGQVRGLQRMVEDDKYCIDILTQVSAVTKALQAVALGLLDEHLRHCVADAVAAGGPEADEKVARGQRGHRPARPVLTPRPVRPRRHPMSTATYTVTGMTCGHCVASVTEEVTEVPGVTAVDVELASGAVTVTSEQPLDDDAVRAAVEEAGYKLAEPTA